MKIYYGRRSWVPVACPKCNTKYIECNEDSNIASITNTLKNVYNGYLISVEKHPFWKIPRWYGECSACRFKEMVYGENPLLQFMREWANNN